MKSFCLRASWSRINSWTCCLPLRRKNRLLWSWALSFAWVHVVQCISLLFGQCEANPGQPDMLFSLPVFWHWSGGCTQVGSFLNKAQASAERSDWGEEERDAVDGWMDASSNKPPFGHQLVKNVAFYKVISSRLWLFLHLLWVIYLLAGCLCWVEWIQWQGWGNED